MINRKKLDLSDRFHFCKKIWRWLITQTLYRLLFEAVGKRSIVYKPIMLMGTSGITIGSRVFVREGARLECVSIDGRSSRILIGDGVSIEQNLHMVSCGDVQIGNYVTIAPNVNLVGGSHAFDEAPSAVSRVTKFDKAPQFIHIGEYSFIGAGSTILSNCRIGKHVVIGAHTLVNKDIPDYAMVAGSPARVVKVFDQKLMIWRKPVSDE